MAIKFEGEILNQQKHVREQIRTTDPNPLTHLQNHSLPENQKPAWHIQPSDAKKAAQIKESVLPY